MVVFISFSLWIDIQVSFKAYRQFEYKELFICCDKKKIRMECIAGNYAWREKACKVNIQGKANGGLK